MNRTNLFKDSSSIKIKGRGVSEDPYTFETTINTEDFATAAQGALADSAVQPGDLASVATSGAYSDLTGTPTLFSGSYNDLTDTPTLGTAASADTGDFATAAQGSLADSSVQPGDLATVATTGAYSDLTGTPSLGNIATITVPTSDPEVANTVWFDGTNLVVSTGA